MLQRIQSVWLLLAAICSFLTLKYSFYSGVLAADNTYHKINGLHHLGLTLLTLSTAIVSLVAIFLFKNRGTQRWLVLGALVLQVATIALYIREKSLFRDGTYDLTAIFSIGVLVFLVLAWMGITRDMRMLKNADRLR